MERTRLWLAGSAVGLTLLVLWHRNKVRDERQRAVSEERRRINTEKRAA
jgi:hypothetical protein